MDDTIMRKLARIPTNKCLFCFSTLKKSDCFRASRLVPGARVPVFQVFCNADCYEERQKVETELGFFFYLNSDDEREQSGPEPDDSEHSTTEEYLD